MRGGGGGGERMGKAVKDLWMSAGPSAASRVMAWQRHCTGHVLRPIEHRREREERREWGEKRVN